MLIPNMIFSSTSYVYFYCLKVMESKQISKMVTLTCFQRLDGVFEYADSEYDILITSYLYICCLHVMKSKIKNSRKTLQISNQTLLFFNMMLTNQMNEQKPRSDRDRRARSFKLLMIKFTILRKGRKFR